MPNYGLLKLVSCTSIIYDYEVKYSGSIGYLLDEVLKQYPHVWPTLILASPVDLDHILLQYAVIVIILMLAQIVFIALLFSDKVRIRNTCMSLVKCFDIQISANASVRIMSNHASLF